MCDLAEPTNDSTQEDLHKAAKLLNDGRRNVAGLLAQAALAFALDDHAGALRLYSEALRAFPTCPPEVCVISTQSPLFAMYARTPVMTACCVPPIFVC